MRVDSQGRAHLAAEVQAVGIDVGDDNIPCAGLPYNRDSHDSDGTRSGDEHIFTEHGKRERRVYGVAEGIEDRRNFLVDIRIVTPDVGHGQCNQFGESPWPVDAHAFG